jgi:hypothetical protein
MMKGFKNCQNKYVEDTMKEFETQKLKIYGKKIVTNRKQAIAIALNTKRKSKYISI